MAEGESPKSHGNHYLYEKNIEPVSQHNIAKGKFWYKQEKQNEIIKELGLL